MSLAVPEAAVKSSCRETDQESGDRDETVEGRQESAPLPRPCARMCRPDVSGTGEMPVKELES